MKELFGALAVILTFVAYIPYYYGIIRGKIRPHIYSWTLWGLTTVLIVAMQLRGRAGAAAWVTVAAGLLSFGVVLLALLKRGKLYIKKSDTFIVLVWLLAIGFWYITSQPVLSMYIIVAADMLAFYPTVRKSWRLPRSEALSLYMINALRYCLAVLAIENYSVTTTLWPAAWVVANSAFSIFLIVRRRQLPKSKRIKRNINIAGMTKK